MRKIFGGYMSAVRNGVCSKIPTITLANNREEALGRLQLDCLKVFPQSQGFYEHFSDCVEATQEMIQVICKKEHR